MQRSSLGKWALQRRFEAHIVLPGLVSLILIALYFFGPLSVQTLVAPGVYELPFSEGRTLGLAHIVMGTWLAWALLLGVSTLAMTRDPGVWLVTIFIMTTIVLSLMMWFDGHTVTSRISALWLLTSNDQGPVSVFLQQQQSLLDLAAVGLFTLLVFIVIPLVYGDSRNPVVSMLVPSRWLASTALIMFASLWLAFRLQGQGWDQVMGEQGALDGDLSPFAMPVFLYILLLYMARLQYRTWVRREADNWNPVRARRNQ